MHDEAFDVTVDMVVIPNVVGACFYGELVAWQRPRQRDGELAYDQIVRDFDSPKDELQQKLERDLKAVGRKDFAKSWRFLVARFDSLGAARMRAELDRIYAEACAPVLSKIEGPSTLH